MKKTLITLASVATLTAAANAQTYTSVNSTTHDIFAGSSIIQGITATGTATTTNNSINVLTNGSGFSPSSDNRAFVSNGTLDYSLGGFYDLTNVEFYLHNVVVDDRLQFDANVLVSTDNGVSYNSIFNVNDPFDNVAGEFHTVGTLSGLTAIGVTDIRFDITNIGNNVSFTEIRVKGAASAVPEPSSTALLGLGGLALLARRKRS